jgi:hypothetical protein
MLTVLPYFTNAMTYSYRTLYGTARVQSEVRSCLCFTAYSNLKILQTVLLLYTFELQQTVETKTKTNMSQKNGPDYDDGGGKLTYMEHEEDASQDDRCAEEIPQPVQSNNATVSSPSAHAVHNVVNAKHTLKALANDIEHQQFQQRIAAHAVQDNRRAEEIPKPAQSNNAAVSSPSAHAVHNVVNAKHTLKALANDIEHQQFQQRIAAHAVQDNRSAEEIPQPAQSNNAAASSPSAHGVHNVVNAKHTLKALANDIEHQQYQQRIAAHAVQDNRSAEEIPQPAQSNNAAVSFPPSPVLHNVVHAKNTLKARANDIEYQQFQQRIGARSNNAAGSSPSTYAVPSGSLINPKNTLQSLLENREVQQPNAWPQVAEARTTASAAASTASVASTVLPSGTRVDRNNTLRSRDANSTSSKKKKSTNHHPMWGRRFRTYHLMLRFMLQPPQNFLLPLRLK